MSDADEERIIADMRGRLRRRALLIVLTSFAVIATEFVLGMGFHMITLPLRWQSLGLVTGIAVLVALVGIAATYRATCLPPEALTARITLRNSDVGFWSVLAGLLVLLALGLTRPAWAVEALPVLIAVGVSVPAATIALLHRRAERDA